MTESDVHLWTPERWARFERARRTRRSIMRWRWVVVALTGLLAAALLLRGNVVIGGLLAGRDDDAPEAPHSEAPRARAASVTTGRLTRLSPDPSRGAIMAP
jgi:hypothetical protein